MAAQYSFVMKGLTKAFPGAHKPILNNIHLQFYSGRQDRHRRPERLGQVDADEDHGRPRQGVHRRGLAGRGITVGYLEQEPQLDPSKTVKENVMDGVRPVADMLDRFNAISAQMADPPERADFDALMTEMGELQEKIDAVDGWTLDNQLEIAMDALRCPPGDSAVDEPLRRREAPGRADPAAARKARHPAARRADQPSRRRERPVARKASRRLSRQRHPRHPRPLLPRQCRELGARARSRSLLHLRIQLFRLSGEEG